MKTNSELTVALLVTALMILICTIIVVAGKKGSNTDPVDLKVYQLGSDQKTYYMCDISTEEMLEINSELTKTKKFTTDNQVSGGVINGNYEIIKIVDGEEQIYAFDNNESNQLFIGNQNRLYKFETTIYDIVINACNR